MGELLTAGDLAEAVERDGVIYVDPYRVTHVATLSREEGEP